MSMRQTLYFPEVEKNNGEGDVIAFRLRKGSNTEMATLRFGAHLTRPSLDLGVGIDGLEAVRSLYSAILALNGTSIISTNVRNAVFDAFRGEEEEDMAHSAFSELFDDMEICFTLDTSSREDALIIQELSMWKIEASEKEDGIFKYSVPIHENGIRHTRYQYFLLSKEGCIEISGELDSFTKGFICDRLNEHLNRTPCVLTDSKVEWFRRKNYVSDFVTERTDDGAVHISGYDGHEDELYFIKYLDEDFLTDMSEIFQSLLGMHLTYQRIEL